MARMARLAATASLAVFLLSLLAVASCRVLETEPDTAVAVSDERGPPSPASASDDAAAVVIPAVAVGEGFLRLPSSHRHHRGPCRHGQGLHRHLWWARHHGYFHRRGVFPGPGEARVHPGPGAIVVPADLEVKQVEELKAVAEPDPDSRPDTEGGEQTEDAVEEEANKPLHGEDAQEENHDAMVKAWKGEMLRRFHSHHHRHHHEEDDDQEGRAGGMKRRFHFHHHRHEEEAEMTTTARNKRFFHPDGPEEVDEVEELARRLSKAIMRRRFDGRHHQHHHAEDQSGEGGVKRWFKRLMNRF